jgi:hypothetical protein
MQFTGSRISSLAGPTDVSSIQQPEMLECRLVTLDKGLTCISMRMKLKLYAKAMSPRAYKHAKTHFFHPLHPDDIRV